MSQTLYRKYRPATFEELTGQQHIKTILQNQLATGTVAHAYLFTGPRGVGKTTTARLLAAGLNGKDTASQEAILEGKDFDVIEIDAASHTKVDNVRENIIENIRFAPQKEKYKIFIIDEVHMLSTAAFNALLKTLEEPPARTIFILATTELHKVPATIISRCQRFDFKKINSHDMLTRLRLLASQEDVRIDDQVLEAITRYSEGCLRDAESLLGQIISLGEKEIGMEQASLLFPRSLLNEALQLVKCIAKKDASAALELVHEVVDQGGDIDQFMKDIVEVLRKLMLYEVVGSLHTMALQLSESMEKELQACAQEMSIPATVRAIDSISKRRLDIKTAAIPYLPLELAILEILFPGQGTSVHTQAPQKTVTRTQQEITQPQQKPQKQSVESSHEERVVEKEEVPLVQENPEPTQEQTKVTDLTIEVVKNQWTALLQELQKKNPSIVLILKTAEPLRCSDGVITIGYKYPFHKDRMTQSSSYDSVREAGRIVFGGVVDFTGEILPPGHVSDFIQEATQHDEVELIADTNIPENTTLLTQTTSEDIQQEEQKEEFTTQPQQPGSDDIIKSLIQAFGGKVVE